MGLNKDAWHNFNLLHAKCSNIWTNRYNLTNLLMVGQDLEMACTKFHENQLMIDWEINEKHALLVLSVYPLNPHDALKHHFASPNNDLISWNLVVLEKKNYGTVLKITVYFFHWSPTSSHFHPLQVENCDRNSPLVVDEDENSKFRLERVKC